MRQRARLKQSRLVCAVTKGFDTWPHSHDAKPINQWDARDQAAYNARWHLIAHLDCGHEIKFKLGSVVVGDDAPVKRGQKLECPFNCEWPRYDPMEGNDGTQEEKTRDEHQRQPL